MVGETYPPEAFIEDGFRDLRVGRAGVIVDWLPFEPPGVFHGPWIGAGIEWWKNRVTNDANDQAGLMNSTVFTVGGGYIWKVYHHLYLNPWLAGNVILDGGSATIAGNTYDQPAFIPELSIKIGRHL